MITSRIFWRIFGLYSVLALVAVAVFLSLASANRPGSAEDLSVAQIAWGTFVGYAVISFFATAIIVRGIRRPIRAMTEAANAIADGDLRQSVPDVANDELGVLGEAFNTMTKQLAARIAAMQAQHRELEESGKLLETVFGTMIEAVVVVDGQQQILFANPAARSLLELGDANVADRPLWEAIRTPALGDTVRKVLQKGGSRKTELQFPRSGTTAILLASRLPGKPTPGAVLVLHDVTELRRLENMRRDFVSNVSHELKTPLTAIQAFAETLLDGALDDPAHNREFVERIGEAAERLHALIQDLLALARIESDEQVFDVQPVSLHELVDLCVREHAAVAEAKSLRLVVTHAEGAPHVLADRDGLRTILDNLVDNAINYTPAGGAVTVRYAAEADVVRIEVADTGIGIPREHRDRIFERFYRVDRARSREIGGTGLGLAIVKHLVQEFRGRISLTSEPGHGSTFTVELPAAKRGEKADAN